MGTHYSRISRFIFVAFTLISSGLFAQTVTIFSENMGNAGGGDLSITANSFENSGVQTYSGNSETRTTSGSTGYAGASGNRNVFLSTSGRWFQIAGINTTGYTSLALTLGHFKSTTASSNELVIEVSADGVTYTQLTYSRPTGSGTANWRLISPAGTIPSTSNLRIRFTNTISGFFRVDDIVLTGVAEPCVITSIPSTNTSSLTAVPTCNSASINFTPGNGGKRIVVVSASNFSNTPSNAAAYPANTAFGTLGSVVGTGNHVVYNGNGNSVNITGLAINTTYYVKVFEYNGTGTNCDESYLTTGVAASSFTTSSTIAPTANAANINAIPSCTAADITFTAGNGERRIVVISTNNFTNTPNNDTDYTANSAFGSGNQIGAGNYVVSKGTANSVAVTGLSVNTTYYVKVFEYNGTTPGCGEAFLTSGVSSYSFTTSENCSEPRIRGILIDACGAGSSEGINEYILVKNGSDPLPVNDIIIEYFSEGEYCNGGSCGTRTLINNPSFVNELNTTAGCALFQFAPVIPPNANIIIFTGLNPSFNYNFSDQCAGAPVYVIFNNNSNGSGRFSNSNPGNLTIAFTSSIQTVNYDGGETGGNGGFANYDETGNVTYSMIPNCVYPLGVELIDFSAEIRDSEIELSWKTLSERNADNFSVLRAGSDMNFSSIGTLKCAGNSETILNYHFSDRSPFSGINYYKLKQVDFDGKASESEIVAVNLKAELLVSYIMESEQLLFREQLSEGTAISVINLSGQQMQKTLISERTYSVNAVLKPGIYIVRTIDSNGKEFSSKVAVY